TGLEETGVSRSRTDNAQSTPHARRSCFPADLIRSTGSARGACGRPSRWAHRRQAGPRRRTQQRHRDLQTEVAITFDSFARAHQPAVQARTNVVTDRTVTITTLGTFPNDNAAETVRKGSVADPQFMHLIPGASGHWMMPLRTDRNMDGEGLETWRDSSSGSSLSLSSVCASDRYGQGAPGGTPSGKRLGRYFWSIVPKAGSS